MLVLEPEMDVVPLHKHKEFVDLCTEILNEKWPRSKAARLHSLSKSCDNLPICLAFLKKCPNETAVLGYSQIRSVQGMSKAGLLESVIVRVKDRGKGNGRTLMELTEKYAKSIGLEMIYLNTVDKEGFYAHLGYIRCRPVISLGDNAHRIPKSMLQHFMASVHEPSTETSAETMSNISSDASMINSQQGNRVVSSLPAPSTPAPPPPPPLPVAREPQSSSDLLSNSNIISRIDKNSVIWMRKQLH